MFYRQKFVTNSSSTSFIFFGVKFDEVGDDTIIEKIIAPEKRNKETLSDLSEQFYYWAEGLKGEIGVYADWEGQDGVVYIRDTFMELSECGYDDLPVKELKAFLSGDKEKEWSKKILDFCEKYGLVPSTGWGRDGKPKWSIALSVNR